MHEINPSQLSLQAIINIAERELKKSYKISAFTEALYELNHLLGRDKTQELIDIEYRTLLEEAMK
jgi:hypothetical protein